MPEQKPGRSKQDYGTPQEFIDAVTVRFGPLNFDLAADETNAKAQFFYTENDDSLASPWPMHGNLWLNPPYSDIRPWAEKCACHSRYGSPFFGRILMLVPASIGSNWFADYVHEQAYILALSPRITFEGCETPYPKDCMLACYGGHQHGFDTWRWK